MTKKRKTATNRGESKTIKNLDEARKLQSFREELPAALRDDILNGTTAEDLMKKYETIAVARLIQILQTETDSGKALGAAKEVLDRIQGKPTQKQEVEHRYQKLQDEELDSVLETLISESDD